MQKMGWFGVVRGHSRSMAMLPFVRAHTTSYSTLIETMCLSFTVFEMYIVCGWSVVKALRHFAGHAITCWLYWVKVMRRGTFGGHTGGRSHSCYVELMGRGTFGGHTGAEASYVMWSSWEGALFRVIVGAEVM